MLPSLLGASDPPAGGAATSEVIIATAGALVVTVLLLGPVLLYKLGRPARAKRTDRRHDPAQLSGAGRDPGADREPVGRADPPPRCPPVARCAQGSGRGRGRMSLLPLAHAGHWLVDLAFFVVPVGILLATIVVLNRRGPKDG